MRSFFEKLLNFKERIHHTLSSEEIALLKKTNLFSNMSESEFNSMCRSLKLIRYPAGSLILREGEKGNTFYVVKEGAVRVYTLDENSKKIPKARLNKGDYFGEQALLERARKTRSANIEAIEPTTLIAINGDTIAKHFNISPTLSKKGLQDAVKTLALVNESYSQLERMISQIPNPEIISFSTDETIFNIGDKADYVYLILQGEINILVPEKDSHKFNSIILHKGHLFGELGILENTPRQATARSHTDTQLLRINGQDFQKYLPQHEALQKILAGLKNVYQIPKKGSVERYLGRTENKLPIITTLYNLEDGRTVIASRIPDQDSFSMRTVNLSNEKCHQYGEAQKQIKIYTQDRHCTGIETTGPCDYLPEICGIILENETFEDAALTQFESTGEIPILKRKSNKDEAEIICVCLSVTRKQIQDQIDSGVQNLTGISEATGACTSCGACRYRILEMLGQSVWSSGTLKKIMTHNSYINSYQITLIDSQFNEFRPGQHLIIQIRVDNNWIERPYSISDILSPDGSLRITIKKEPKGYFSGWLFSQTQEEFQINVTQAQGDFTLKEGTPLLCFAGGIGITPFITFARHLTQKQLKQKMHLVYTALTQEDFILTDVLNQLAKENPFVTVEYRPTNLEGYLTESDITRNLQALGAPDVYICGPAPFLSLIEGILENQKYPSDKIHIEKFVHAGGK